MSYDNIPSISTEQRVLPDRLYVQTDTDSNITKRQTSSIQYSILAPVVFIANVMNRTLVESVTHDFRSINDSNRNETIEFTAVGMSYKLQCSAGWYTNILSYHGITMIPVITIL